MAFLLSVETYGVASMQVTWDHGWSSGMVAGMPRAGLAGRYDAVALHVTVCKPLWTPHANGLALPSVAYLKGAKENSVASTS